MNTQESFIANFKNIMTQAGYSHIHMPADLSCFVNLWAKPVGAVCYCYALYNMETIDAAAFAELKSKVDEGIAALVSRNGLRHCVTINIMVGVNGENKELVEKLINASGALALTTNHDIFFGIDPLTSCVLRNAKQPPNIDGCLDKIQAAFAKDYEIVSTKNTAQAVTLSKHSIATYVIIGINLMLFVLMETSGGSTNIETLLNYGAVTHYHVFTLGQYYRLVTPIFLHIGIAHLGFNTMSLVLFGIRAERYFGVWKYLVIYVLSGVAGNLAMALTSTHAVGAGASGSIYGIIGALFALTKIRKKNAENFNAGSLGIMIVVGILMGFTMTGVPGMPNVANSAHIGGLVVGFALGWLLTIEKSKRF